MIVQQSAWNYAISRYQQPKVESHMLRLQDNYHCNVNIVLLLAYIDQQLMALSPHDVDNLSMAITDSEEKLTQFRLKRRAAKLGDQSVYQQLKKRELEMEYEQHALLIETANRSVQNAQAIASSLVVYLTTKNVADSDIKKACSLLSDNHTD